MKIAQLVPGTCNAFYCENCLRDYDLNETWRALGHDADLVPLYLPLLADGQAAVTQTPMFFGGVNVYLQQKSAFFRKTPRWLDRLFDSRRLLEWVSRKVGMTSAHELGETTLSMLRGEAGRQAKEVRRLVEYLAGRHRPDVVCLSNVLLAALARPIGEAVGVPVVCLLQDEDAFLDALPEAHRGPAWDLLRACAAEVDGFVAVSSYYRDAMIRRLGLPPARVAVVRYGINPEGYFPAEVRPDPPVIGFLGAAEPNKDLGALVEAFADLKNRPGLRNLRLRAAGGHPAGNAKGVEDARRRLAARSLEADAEFLPNLGRAQRQDFLRTLSVLSVPTKRPEAYGMYVLEALASGVPVVAPRHGGIVELVEETGGGLLVEPNDPPALAEALAALLLDPEKARAMAERGRRAVAEKFDSRRTARDVVAVFEQTIARV